MPDDPSEESTTLELTEFEKERAMHRKRDFVFSCISDAFSRTRGRVELTAFVLTLVAKPFLARAFPKTSFDDILWMVCAALFGAILLFEICILAPYRRVAAAEKALKTAKQKLLDYQHEDVFTLDRDKIAARSAWRTTDRRGISIHCVFRNRSSLTANQLGFLLGFCNSEKEETAVQSRAEISQESHPPGTDFIVPIQLNIPINQTSIILRFVLEYELGRSGFRHSQAIWIRCDVGILISPDNSDAVFYSVDKDTSDRVSAWFDKAVISPWGSHPPSSPPQGAVIGEPRMIYMTKPPS